MIKEHIKVLDNLRSEEVRFNFNPTNRNLCFSGGSYTGGEGNIFDEFSGMLDSMNPFTSGSGGGDVETSGGLDEEDKAMKQMFYKEIKSLFDKQFTPYTEDRYTDRSQEELDLLAKMKAGGGYKDLYDQASQDLGFTKKAYKDAYDYDIAKLDQDAEDIMGAGSTYRSQVSDKILEQMGRGASMAGMNLAPGANQAGVRGYDRDLVARDLSNQNYLSQAGSQLAQLNMGAYQNALQQARTLQQDKLSAAQGYGSTVMEDLGIGTGGLDKYYSTAFGGFKQDRDYLDRDKGFKYKTWQDEQNYDAKKLGLTTGLYGNMPFEEKVVSSQPASGGK